jgi:hypothetical protein
MVCAAVNHGDEDQDKIVWIMKVREDQKEGETGSKQEEQEIQKGWRK